MLQPCCEDNTNTISPNLLRNFNAYEILEPQRSNDVANVDTLIDFNDNCPNSNRNIELSAPFIDVSNNYDLIDLYQNIYVSPQQIVTNQTHIDVIKPCNIDYNDFFDKLESGGKVDNGMTQRNNEDKPVELNSDFDIKPKVLVPSIDLDSDSDPEDLIDKLISTKIMKRQILSQIDNRQPSTSSLQVETKSLDDSIKPSEYINLEIKSHKENNNVTELTQQQPLNSQISNSLDNTFIVKAFIKDEKAYRRSRIVKSDREKQNYTKGPDFEEKKIVLPQIMRRLTERKLALNDEKCWKKRLILDSGAPKESCSNCSKTTENKVPNCNSGAATQSVAFNSSKQLQSTPNSMKTASTSKSSASVSNPLKIYIDNITTSGTSLDSKYLTASTRSKNINSPSNGLPKSSGPGESSEPSSTDNSPLGTLRPVVLMEDCNKVRLLAWRQGRMISNLVRTGKLTL